MYPSPEWLTTAKNKANEILEDFASGSPLKVPVPINDLIEEYLGDVSLVVRQDLPFSEGVSAFSRKDMGIGWIVAINGMPWSGAAF